MIKDQQRIEINALPEEVFEIIENMPNKFPVYKILETKPFFFIRILLVDGLQSALNMLKHEISEKSLLLNVGDSMGPFKLTDFKRPDKYIFSLKSFFFKCETGYVISKKNNKTTLYFDLISKNPGFKEKFWWFFVKPIHGLLAEKSLKSIKDKVELKI